MTTIQAPHGTAEPIERPTRRRVLLAPVTVTPTKPLSPSHLKGLLWTDVMFRATRVLADVTYRYSHTTYDPCEQTLGFWEYLDRTQGDVDYSRLSEDDIGELYVRYRESDHRAPFAAYRPYIDAIERHGWVHPASARVLGSWSAQYARLGLHDPGLDTRQPPEMTTAEMIDALAGAGMCLDLRQHGGPVYLDATRHGLPLRQIVAADGRPNYLACALRELVPLAPRYDEVVLLYNRGLESDYLLLERVMTRLGADVRRVALGRVPINGRIGSARDGDWRGRSACSLLDRMTADHSEPALRLGIRLYFIATLGPGDRTSFDLDLLRRSLNRAERLLAASPVAGPVSVTEYLARHRGDHCYVDPYRLTTGLLARHRGRAGRELLAEVFT